MPTTTQSKKTATSKKIPYHYKPQDLSYEERQIWLRRQYAHEQSFVIKNIWDHAVYSDFELTNPDRWSHYKVAIRWTEPWTDNYCSCKDFAINTLGTCKHIEYILYKLRRNPRTKGKFKDTYKRSYSSLSLSYSSEWRKLKLRIGTKNTTTWQTLATDYFDSDFVWIDKDFRRCDEFMKQAFDIDAYFRIYQDALDYIIAHKDAFTREELVSKAYPKGSHDSKLRSLLSVDLYPYQKEAVLAMARTGRSILADDMGLGKTIQAIGAAEVMNRLFGIEKVLIVCPTSLKYQRQKEIEKFCQRSSLVIEWPPAKRKQIYGQSDAFFNIITYNIVKNDLDEINAMQADLVILDEAQRIKNRKTQTAQSVKKVQSPYAIVLTWTPLENKIEELHSITEFIDPYRLWPLFRFLADHQLTDASGKVIWYQKLHDIKQALDTVMIRRTRAQILKQLPERIDKNIFVPMTPEQTTIHQEHADIVARLVHKWRKHRFLSEKERHSLMINLNCMRMVCDSSYILDEETRHDTKIGELMNILREAFDEDPDKKVVIFSQRKRMTHLLTQEFESHEIAYQYLHGGVPSKKRRDLLDTFHADPDCRIFLSTDAGSTWLNLQCASLLINMDLPRNPAVLEQRIARIHRLGQKQKVQIINFVSKWGIEEQMLSTIAFKKSVFDGVLDWWADTVYMTESSFKTLMKQVGWVVDEEVAEPGTQGGELGIETWTSQWSHDISSPSQQSSWVAGKIPPSTPATQEGKQPKAKQQKMPSWTLSQEQVTSLVNDWISLLWWLAKLMTPDDSWTSPLQNMIAKDKTTWQISLNIPLPNEDVVQQATQLFSAFLGSLGKKE